VPAVGPTKAGWVRAAVAGGELKRGTVYVTLNRMEDKGLVESELEKDGLNEVGLPRRLYKLSGHGARILRVWSIARQQWAGVGRFV